MRIRSPTSRASINIHFSPFDVAIAALSPYLALYLRSAQVLISDPESVAAYCLTSFVFSLVAFSIFKIEGAIPRYISVNDVLSIAKAVLLAELLTGVVFFTFTRLDGIPRTVPTIHALILGAGLVSLRGLARLVDRRRQDAGHPQLPVENLILIGLNDLSALWIKYLDTHTQAPRRVVGLLDPEPRWIGRAVHGVRVYGPPSHLGALIEEFATHGVRINRILASGEPGTLLKEEVSAVRRVCEQHNLALTFIRDPVAHRFGDSATSGAVVSVAQHKPAVHVTASTYFSQKGRVEFVVALALLLLLSPLWLIAAALALLDVGSPTLFWQQRVGLHGRDFQLYKIRTLRAAYDRNGRKTPEDQRLSWIGRLLRHTRIDELPQMLNVLVGDMSLVGPRPLLPEDQPSDPSVRLMVRPGITGWAQVNGGALLSPQEKDQLDAWYVHHASPWLDIRIIGMTLRSFVRGDHRSDAVLALALADQDEPTAREKPLAGDDRAAGPAPVAIDGDAPAVPSL